MRIPASLRTYLREARSAFAYAPVEVLLGLLLAVTFSIAVRQKDGEEWWGPLAAAAALSMPLVFAMSVLRARRVVAARATWLASAAVLAGAGAYAALVFDPDLSSERWRWAALAAAAVLALTCAPVPGGGGRERVRRRLWAFDIALLLRVVGVGAYGALLFAALAGAVAAVSKLFELKTPDHLYADLAGAVFFALVPWAVAGGVPALAAAGEAGVETEGGAVRVAARFGRFLYAPVLGVYLLILYAYTVKVLVTGEMPQNLLSPIVLFAGLAGFLGAVLLEPLRGDPERRGVERLVRAFPLLLLPLLPLAVWAVGVRLAQFGWTEFRYLRLALLLALGVLALMGTARLVRRREPLLAGIPAALSLALLLSAVGPWSAVAVSRRDQQARLRAALAQAGRLDESGHALLPDTSAPARVVPREVYDQLAGSAAYLYGAHGADALRPLVPRPDRFDNGWELTRALRVEAGCEPRQVQYAQASLPDGLGVAGLPAGTLYRLNAVGPGLRGAPPERSVGGVRMQARGAVLVVRSETGDAPAGAWQATIGLGELVTRIAARGPDGCGPQYGPEPPALPAADAVRPLVDAAGRDRGVLVLTSLAVRWDSAASALVIQHADGLAVVR